MSAYQLPMVRKLYMSKSALFFADSHLDLGAWANRPSLRGDSMHAFEHIVREAIHRKVSAIFAAGDLIDVRKPPSDVIEFIRNKMSWLEKNSIPFYYIQGQHEFATPPWFSAIHDWPIWLDGTSVEVNGIRVRGLDWTPADRLSEALAGIHNVDILVAHQVWEEFMGSIRGCEGSFSQVRAPVLFTGDYHSNQERDDFRGADGQKLTVISPGATNIRKIDEPAEHYFYTLDEAAKWTRHSIPGRQVLGYTITDEDGLDKLIGKLPDDIEKARRKSDKLVHADALRTPIIWVKYVENIDNAYGRLEACIGDNGHFFARPVRAEDEAITVERKKRKEVMSNGLVGCLELLVAPKKEKQDYQALHRLLTCADPKLELQVMKKERGL